MKQIVNSDQIVELLGYKESLRLTDNGNGQIDVVRIDQAINAAETIIKSYLLGRNSIFNDNGEISYLLELIAKNLSIVNLYESTFNKTSVPNTIVWKKIDTYKLLKQIQNGEIHLNDQADQAPFIRIRKVKY